MRVDRASSTLKEANAKWERSLKKKGLDKKKKNGGERKGWGVSEWGHSRKRWQKNETKEIRKARGGEYGPRKV